MKQIRRERENVSGKSGKKLTKEFDGGHGFFILTEFTVYCMRK